MSKNVKHKRSSVVSNGHPKLPNANTLEVGELAINFADGYETLSILNSSDEIATFSSDEIIEAKIPTDTDISNSGYTKSAITGVVINGNSGTVVNGVASLDVSGLPPVTSDDNGKVLAVVNGQWSASTPLMVYSGNDTPSVNLGKNGDIFLQVSNNL